MDVTAFKRTASGGFIELCEPSGDDSGGTFVDKKFLDILEDIVGHDVMRDLENVSIYTDSWFDLLRQVESIKRRMFSPQNTNITIKFPLFDLDKLCRKYHDKTFEDVVQNSRYNKSIHVRKYNVSFSVDLLKSIFEQVVNKMINFIQPILKKQDSIDTIVLAGGFSASRIILAEMKEAFPNVKIISPPDSDTASLTVVKGAVLLGQKSFVTQFILGRETQPFFDESKHDIKRRITIDGQDRCARVFEVLVKNNTSIKVGTFVSKEYELHSELQSSIRISLFRTENENVYYVDDHGCTLFADVFIEVPRSKIQQRTIVVRFEFGIPEFQVKAFDKRTKQYLNVSLSMKG